MFLRKFNIKLRRVQTKRQIDKSKFAPEMMKWHCTLCEGVIKSCSHLPDYDPKWGRFPPNKRVNSDQIPLPIAINGTTTYEEEIPKELRKYHKVWVTNPGAGLEKRQCSVQLAFSPEDDNLRVVLIFRVTGERISEDEINSYHKSVAVHWQQNAWADTIICVNSSKKKFLAPAMKDKQDFILFCDNLEGQTALLFQEEVRKSGGIKWYGVKKRY